MNAFINLFTLAWTFCYVTRRVTLASGSTWRPTRYLLPVTPEAAERTRNSAYAEMHPTLGCGFEAYVFAANRHKRAWQREHDAHRERVAAARVRIERARAELRERRERWNNDAQAIIEALAIEETAESVLDSQDDTNWTRGAQAVYDYQMDQILRMRQVQRRSLALN